MASINFVTNIFKVVQIFVTSRKLRPDIFFSILSPVLDVFGKPGGNGSFSAKVVATWEICWARDRS